MSEKYKLMIYFAVTTMLIYKKDTVLESDMSPYSFYKKNPELMKRVFEEGVNIYNYEMSHNQIMKACYIYLSAEYNPTSVHETEPYIIEE